MFLSEKDTQLICKLYPPSVLRRGYARHLTEGAVEGIYGGEAAFHGYCCDALGLVGEQLFCGIYSVERQKFCKLYARQLVEGMGEVFFVIAEFCRDGLQGHILGVMLRNVGDDLLI